MKKSVEKKKKKKTRSITKQKSFLVLDVNKFM